MIVRRLYDIVLATVQLASEPEPFYVCCHCDRNDNLDNKALVLVRRFCALHGECWHRIMVMMDGEAVLALPVNKAAMRSGGMRKRSQCTNVCPFNGNTLKTRIETE